jgi:hypothetical protein
LFRRQRIFAVSFFEGPKVGQMGCWFLRELYSGQQQCPVIGIDYAVERGSAKRAIEFVALKSMGVEVGYAGSAKQESCLAFRAFNFSKPFVCFGHHANTT